MVVHQSLGRCNHSGLDMLEYRTDVPVHYPKAGEVLIEVAAAGIMSARSESESEC